MRYRWGYYLTLGLLTLLGATLWVAAAMRPISETGRYGPQTFWYSENTRDLGEGGGTLRGSADAGVRGHALRLSVDQGPRSLAVFVLPDLDPDRSLREFDVRFDLGVFSQLKEPLGSVTMTFCAPGRTPGGGLQGFTDDGLSIRFDARHHGDEPSSIDLIVDGRTIASSVHDFKHRSRRFEQVVIHWDEDGLDLEYRGRPIFTDQRLRFLPRIGYRFGFAALTGRTGLDTGLDNLRVQTVARPSRPGQGVVLSEIMPRPRGGLRDEDLELVDWIELHNYTNAPRYLLGYQLRLRSSEATETWKFPDTEIAPFDHLLVFATGKDRHGPGAIHTNFRLPDEGAELQLVDPRMVTASRFQYSQASPGVSFGWLELDAPPGFLDRSTPGQPNRGKLARRAEAPAVQISHPGGILTEPLTVTISSDRLPSGGVIRFTLDGKKPDSRSPVYRQALTIAHSTTLRAALFAEGHLPGPIAQSGFLFLDREVSAFHSNLPILIVDSAGRHIDAEFSPFSKRKYRPVYTALFEPATTDGRTRTTSNPCFAGFGAMRVRGHSSAVHFPKKQYAWEIRDDRGEDRDVALLGMPADSDWVLAAPYDDKTLMRNVVAFRAGQIMFGPAGGSRTRFLEVFFNQDGDDVTMADYQGVYVLTEKIKRSKGRLDIARLNETIIDADQITGGYIFKFDKGLDWDQRVRTRKLGLRLGVVAPNRLNAVQTEYLTEYLSNFENSLDPALRADPDRGYRAFIDTDSFLHLNWMVEIFYEIDGWWLSTFFTKPRGGVVRAMPVWDYNLSMGNFRQLDGFDSRGWHRDHASGHPWFKRLLADPVMQDRYWDLYDELRRHEFSNQEWIEYLGSLERSLEEAAARNFKRWPILGKSVWPHARGSLARRSFRDEVEFMRGWLIRRLEWIDSQSVPRPILELVGDHLQISLAEGRQGRIFYTTDGTDPGASRNPEPRVLLDGDAVPGRVLVPSHGNGGDQLKTADWTGLAEPPDPASWDLAERACVGYERGTKVFEAFLRHRVDSMYDKATSCYIRIPFELEDLDLVGKANDLCLRMRYDDGFVAYLNGQKIAEMNAPPNPDWRSAATRTASTGRAGRFTDFDIGEFRGAFRRGKNLLAIHGLNQRKASSDALWGMQLTCVDPASLRPPTSTQAYTARIPLAGVAKVRVAVFTGKIWGRTVDWTK